MRWGAYLCAAGTVVMFVCSFVVHLEITAEYYKSNQFRGDWSNAIRLSNGRIRYVREQPREDFVLFDQPVAGEFDDRLQAMVAKVGKGWVVDACIVERVFPPDPSWWAWIQRGGGGSQNRIHSSFSIPLVYPCIVGVGLACLLMVRSIRSRQRSGGCEYCGYSHEGLTSSICPECGVARG